MATITVAEAIAYARQAGFTGQPLIDIVAIAWAESGLNTTVTNSIGATGVLQILLSAHPDVTSSQAKDPAFSFRYAYKLSGGGKNFCAWQSYKTTCGRGYDNRYAQYVPQVEAQVNLGAGTAAATFKQGTTNTTYVKGQCTDWASQRYHTLTGFWVGNYWGDAHNWAASATRDGWKVTALPPTTVPCIICLQGGAGQGVLDSAGHVAVVEKVNPDGSVYTSNYNWSKGPGQLQYVTFKPGQGVSFIYAPVGSANLQTGSGSSGGNTGTYTPLLSQVHDTLVNVPGFYGISLALDEAEQYPGWVNLTSGQWDVVGYIRSTGATISDNFVPFMIRGTLFSVGLFIMILLILKIVLEVGDKAMPIIAAAGA